MPGRTPRSARVPHTEKRPERCPHCGSIAITRKGTRRKKIEIVQLWRCSSCKRVFTPTPSALRGKTYPLRIVLDAITLYDLGYSLEATAAKIRARHGHRVGRSTIASWLAEHRSLTTYARLRAEGRRLFPPTQTIRSVKLYHRQVYKFAYHRPKLALLRGVGNTPALRASPISSSGYRSTVRTSCSATASARRKHRSPRSRPPG
jgi:transposase-like protein